MKIGTRGSKLALWQAHTVARLIQAAGGPDCEIVIIRTTGDESPGPPDPPNFGVSSTPPASGSVGTNTSDTLAGPLNVKRTFVKEIEEALLDGRVDLAVHSAKDLPGDLPDGLTIAAALEREDPRDALLLPASHSVTGFEAVKSALGSRPRIGTSSVRRVAQLQASFPDATFTAIRGNVDTRLRKLDGGECDALVLAAAGMKRLGLVDRLSALVPVDFCVPAPGQGIVAVEISERAHQSVRDAVTRIADADAEAALVAERAVVIALGGGCQMPLGALALLEGQDLTIHGVVSSLDGRRMIRGAVHGNRGGAAAAGDKLAAQLLAKGAGDILK
jgi:hydroxymethylbilane synthase